MKFAKRHLKDPAANWQKVLWPDETKVELFGMKANMAITKQHHPYCEAWWWKHYVVGIFLIYRKNLRNNLIKSAKFLNKVGNSYFNRTMIPSIKTKLPWSGLLGTRWMV